MSKLLIDFAKQYYKNVCNMPKQYQNEIRDNLNNKPFNSEIMNDFDVFSVVYSNKKEDKIVVKASGKSGVFNFLINPKQYAKKRVVKLINRYHKNSLSLKEYTSRVETAIKKNSENLRKLVRKKRTAEYMMNTRRTEVLFYCHFWVYFEDIEPLFEDRGIKYTREFLFADEFTDEEIATILGIPMNTVFSKRKKYNRQNNTSTEETTCS